MLMYARERTISTQPQNMKPSRLHNEYIQVCRRAVASAITTVSVSSLGDSRCVPFGSDMPASMPSYLHAGTRY